MSAIVLDADHFKAINDKHGHAVGDAMLRHLAHLMQSTLRKSDLCGWIGGEEFAILLPDTSLQAACTLAEKLRQIIMESPLSCKGVAYLLTVSVGVASEGG